MNNNTEANPAWT